MHQQTKGRERLFGAAATNHADVPEVSAPKCSEEELDADSLDKSPDVGLAEVMHRLQIAEQTVAELQSKFNPFLGALQEGYEFYYQFSCP